MKNYVSYSKIDAIRFIIALRNLKLLNFAVNFGIFAQVVNILNQA